MPLVPMRVLLDHAAENNYGIAAFNVNNMEQIQAVMAAAQQTDSPVIIQASRGALRYCQDAYLRHLMLAAAEMHPRIPLAMHLDHGDSPETCFSAIESGFTSVMMDGSLMPAPQPWAGNWPRLVPAPYDHNVRVTRQVVQRAHAAGVTVEGELGSLDVIEDGQGTSPNENLAPRHLTGTEEVERFVADTGVDALALPIALSYGAYKFAARPTGAVLQMDWIERIHRRLPNTHLVMHGSSSVPEELLDIIRMYGGYMKPTYGVPLEEIQRGIRHGLRKINVDIENRVAMTGAIRRVFASDPSEVDPRKYLGPAREAMRQVGVARMEAFGQAGQAGKIMSLHVFRLKVGPLLRGNPRFSP